MFCALRNRISFRICNRILFTSGDVAKCRSVSSRPPNKENVILMGSPGCGKTTVGRILGKLLKRPVLDVDDHHLETFWNKSVADMLAEVGPDAFVEEEGKAFLHFETSGAVVSLTGSNPMYSEAMTKFAKSGVVVFLDAPIDDIVGRLERMKVNRIVGQGEETPMSDILRYRQQFYEACYDIRVVIESEEEPETVARKVNDSLQKYWSNVAYTSTRTSNAEKKSLSKIILEGLASDGGLYVPQQLANPFSVGELSRFVDLDYNSRALRVMERWINPKDMAPQDIRNYANIAYGDQFSCSKRFPIRHLSENTFLLELFHGPTASFKDAALQLLPLFFRHAIRQENITNRYLILVATSGDTGGAVLDGFTRHTGDSGIKVMVFYPEHGISEVQKAQMTSVQGSNCSVIGVNGNFDDCQNFVKKAFNDPQLKQEISRNGYNFGAANSINWGRLMPQMVYHVSAYLDLVQGGHVTMGDQVDVCVPTGNFGNILAAFYAREMGVPIRKLICASNCNNVLTDFINTGVYDLRSRSLKVTTSPAIDILLSSNLERYLYHIAGGSTDFVRQCYDELRREKIFKLPNDILSRVQSLFQADWCTEEECGQEIARTYKNHGYLLDTHTAVAKVVADRLGEKEVPLILVSTAHYQKFAPDVSEFIGADIKNKPLGEMFRMLNDTCNIPAMHTTLMNSVQRERCHTDVVDASYDIMAHKVAHFAR